MSGMNRALLSQLLALLLLSACQVMQPGTDAGSVVYYEQRGSRAFQAGDYSRARQFWSEGLALARKYQQGVSEINFLINLSNLNELSGLYMAALSDARTAAELADTMGKRGLYVRAVLLQGQAVRRLSRYDEAMSLFEQALTHPQTQKDPYLRCESLRYKGAILQDKGKLDQARPLYLDSLNIAREQGFEESEAKALNNLGLLHNKLSLYQQALQHFEQSLNIREKLGDLPGQSKVLGNLCITHVRLNQFAQARDYCQQSLAIAWDLNDRQRIGNNLNNLGSIYRYLGKNKDAIKYYQKSLLIKKELGDRAGQARVLNNLGELYLAMRQWKMAEAYLLQSLGLKEQLHDIEGQTATYQNLALHARRQGEYDKSIEYYNKALALNNRARRPELIWRTFDGLSIVHQARSRNALAIFYGKQAINIIQQTRANIANLKESVRKSYLRDKERVYRRVADLLIEQGRLLEAQLVIRLLKEEEYLHYRVRSGEEKPADVAATEHEQEWMQRYREIADQLGKIGHDIERLENKLRAGTLSESERLQLNALRDDADIAQKAFAGYLEKLQTAYVNAGSQETVKLSEKVLKGLKSMKRELARMQSPTVVLTYLVTKDKVSLLLTTKKVQIARESKIDRGRLNKLVFEYRNILSSPLLDPREKGKALYDYLIKPVESDLVALEVKTIMVTLDGTLRYLPLAALYDGQQYLVEKYNLALFAPAANTQFDSRRSAGWKVAGLGLSDKVEGFSALPAVKAELDLIVKEDRADDQQGVLPGKVLLNQGFTANSLSDMLSEGFPVIHLASHFVFKPGTAGESFVLLGNGKKLSLSDLSGSRFPFEFIELLTLSACETAVGGEDAQGREIESFAGLALEHGASSILATLWPVADQSTGEFMQLFYKIREDKALTRAESLRRVQRQFLQGVAISADGAGERRGGMPVEGDSDFKPDPKAPYAHPYYWAPFILMGNFL